MKGIYIGKSKIDGKGVFTREDIKKGELIQYITGKRVKLLPKNKKESLSIPTWFGLSRRYWLDPGESHFRFLNHSCNPNATIGGTKSLIALRNIRADEELTFDYSMTDVDPLWEMKCTCGAAKCRGTIRAIQTLPTKVFKRHMPHVPRYFQRAYLRHYITSKL